MDGEASAREGEPVLGVAWEDSVGTSRPEAEEELAVLHLLARRDDFPVGDPRPRAATLWLRREGTSGSLGVVGLEH